MTAEWTFLGHDLTVAGDYSAEILTGHGLPAKRNSDVMVPLTDGEVFARKYFDVRFMTFGMVFEGTSRTDLQTNIDTLFGYLGSRTQGLLSHILPDASVRQAYAEVVQATDPIYKGPMRAVATVEFKVIDPFFRSPTLYELEVTVDATTHDVDVVNSGNAEEHHGIIVFTGPLEHPKLEHLANAVWVQYNAHLAAGATVTINCQNYTAIHSVSGNVINSIVHSGDPTFIYFLPGTNACHCTHANGADTTGKCKVSFYPPFLTP